MSRLRLSNAAQQRLARENIQRLKAQKQQPLPLPTLTTPDDKVIRARRRIGRHVSSGPLSVSLLDSVQS